MTEGRRKHWNEVYEKRDETALTWFEPTADRSFALVTKYLAPGDAMVDVGGGASRLVDRLVAEDFGPVTVLDLSDSALAVSRLRLGDRAGEVTWIASDVARWKPDRQFALWHDRAVFHFLTGEPERAAYVRTMDAALRSGGVAVIATFAEDGPETCSGLPVCRYSPEDLAKELNRLDPGLVAAEHAERWTHVTPKGYRQSFQYSVFRKRP